MVTELNAAKQGRTRTQCQLQRKRTQDKASQKQKRERYKAYVQRIEQELREARNEIDYLGSVIRTAEGVLQSLSPTASALQASATYNSPPECLSLGTGDSHNSTLLFALQRIAAEPYQGGSSSDENWIPAKMNLTPNHPGYQASIQVAPCKGPDISQPAAVVESMTLSQTSVFSLPGKNVAGCTCDPQVHLSYADCFEQTVFMALMEAHRLPQPNPRLRQIARNPSISDLLFLGKGENVVTKILNKVLRRPNPIKLSILFAAYLIVYRVLRYRFFPSLQTLQDIPEWLRPTEVQDSVPHPIFMDFVHFPRLRAAMALGTVTYLRTEFDDDYSRWICFNWPDTRDLILRNHQTGDMILNPDFETQVFTLSSWSLKAAFVSKYPETESLVSVEN